MNILLLIILTNLLVAIAEAFKINNIRRSSPQYLKQISSKQSSHNHQALFLAATNDVPIQTNSTTTTSSKFSRIKDFIGGKGFNKENIAKLGGYALLSYGFVSNISYITCFIISWILHGKKTGLSPLVKGQWKSFLALYAGLWAANNVIRPLRFSLAVFLAPAFEKLIDFIQLRTGFKRASCVGITVFLVNVVGTCSFLFFGLTLGTAFAKVPLLP